MHAYKNFSKNPNDRKSEFIIAKKSYSRKCIYCNLRKFISIRNNYITIWIK